MKPVWDEKVMIVKWSRAHDQDGHHAKSAQNLKTSSSPEARGHFP